MHGNVCEWCSDRYTPYGYGEAPAEGVSPEERNLRVLRGGGYAYSADFCRSAMRYPNPLDDQFYSIGLRPALDVPRDEPAKDEEP